MKAVASTRPDLAYPRFRYAIEFDSHTYHLNREAFERDRERDGNLAQLGWLVRRYTWRQRRDGRPWVVATVRADLRARYATPHPQQGKPG